MMLAVGNTPTDLVGRNRVSLLH